MSIEQFIRIASALLTPLIAVVATYIAWQQWRTNQQRFVMDRYDRRIRIYEEVRKILGIVVRDGGATWDDLLAFWRAVSEADFLFKPEISAYITEIYQRGVRLDHLRRQYRDCTQQDAPPGYDHAKVVDETHKQMMWFSEQFDVAQKKFARYLSISS